MAIRLLGPDSLLDSDSVQIETNPTQLVLGSGVYSTVYRGYMTCPGTTGGGEDARRVVALKTPKMLSKIEDVSKIFEEAALLR